MRGDADEGASRPGSRGRCPGVRNLSVVSAPRHEPAPQADQWRADRAEPRDGRGGATGGGPCVIPGPFAVSRISRARPHGHVRTGPTAVVHRAPDRPPAHRHDHVAEFQKFLELGRREEHDQSCLGGLAQQLVDRGPAADVHAAGRLVEQQRKHVVAAEAAADEDLLLVPAAQRRAGIAESVGQARSARRAGATCTAPRLPDTARAPSRGRRVARDSGRRTCRGRGPRTCGRWRGTRPRPGRRRPDPEGYRPVVQVDGPVASGAARRRRAGRPTRRCRVGRRARRSGRVRGEREVASRPGTGESGDPQRLCRVRVRLPAVPARRGGSPSICTISVSTVRSRGRGGGDSEAVAQHGDRVAQVKDLRQAVRHEDDRAAAWRRPPDRRRRPAGSRCRSGSRSARRGSPAGRLAQCLRDLDQLALADAERGERLVRGRCATGPCRRAPAASGERHVRRRLTSGTCDLAEKHVLQHGQRRYDAEFLVDERYPGPLRRLPAGQLDRVAAEDDAPAVRPSWPDSILTTVLLPAPLCPHRPWISPGPT